MPILNTCCGCCTLKTGTIISGVLGILSALATLIIILVTKIKVKTIVLDNLSPLIALKFESAKQMEETGSKVKIILSINLAMTILISTLLIIGAVKRKRWFMLPWVVLAIILAIGLAISVIYTAVEFYVHKDALSGTLGLIIGLILVAIHIYLWLVVLSYYQLIKEEKNRGPYGRPVYNYYR